MRALRTALLLASLCAFGRTLRVVAVGDVHGDVRALRSALTAARVLTASARGDWCGGAAHLVQLGDVLDRGDDELASYRLLRRLRKQARRCGGDVTWLVGNHEVLNLRGYAPLNATGGFPAADAYARYLPDGTPGDDRSAAAVRSSLFRAGGLWSRHIAAPLTLIVDDVLYAHGGVLPEHLVGDGSSVVANRARLERWNARTRAYMVGEYVPADADRAGLEFLLTATSPAWTRRYSSPAAAEPEPAVRRAADAVLAGLGCRRMVVGHTPQLGGANGRCDGRVWRIDTGMNARFFGGRAEAVEVTDGDVTAVFGGGGVGRVDPEQRLPPDREGVEGLI